MGRSLSTYVERRTFTGWVLAPLPWVRIAPANTSPKSTRRLWWIPQKWAPREVTFGPGATRDTMYLYDGSDTGYEGYEEKEYRVYDILGFQEPDESSLSWKPLLHFIGEDKGARGLPSDLSPQLQALREFHLDPKQYDSRTGEITPQWERRFHEIGFTPLIPRRFPWLGEYSFNYFTVEELDEAIQRGVLAQVVHGVSAREVMADYLAWVDICVRSICYPWSDQPCKPADLRIVYGFSG